MEVSIHADAAVDADYLSDQTQMVETLMGWYSIHSNRVLRGLFGTEPLTYRRLSENPWLTCGREEQRFGMF